MATLTLELPSQQAQTAFNLRRWAEVLADPVLARLEGRVDFGLSLARREQFKVKI
jgi:hypothetical protein